MVDNFSSQRITIWEGCDPQLAAAIDKFSERWGPYSATSRRYSIFRLMRELIDPAWLELQRSYPRLTVMWMDLAWKKCHLDHCSSSIDPSGLEDENSAHQSNRASRELVPCAGKINGTYVLSELARHHGFYELETFFISISKTLWGDDGVPPSACFDSLIDFAVACRRKKPKVERVGKLNARRVHLRPYCKSCGQPTELAAHLETMPLQAQDSQDRLRLSTHYCKSHRPKAPFIDAVLPAYLHAKRSQTKFEAELSRLEQQVRGQSSPSSRRTWARSGNALVDDFILHFVSHRLVGIYPDDPRLRDEARQLVDQKITDRKKEIVILLASGLNQTEVASQLGIERQAVSKALVKIPDDLRFDLLPA